MYKYTIEVSDVDLKMLVAYSNTKRDPKLLMQEMLATFDRFSGDKMVTYKNKAS